MPELNLDLDYFDHPKTRRLVSLLGKYAELLPIRLWIYCGKYHCETGKLTGCTSEDIELEVKWTGTRGQCVDALVKVGFLNHSDGEYSVHDWEDHAGHLHALKIRNKANALSRWAKIKSGESVGNRSSPEDATGITSGNAKKDVSQCPNERSIRYVRTKRTDNVPTDEKRRIVAFGESSSALNQASGPENHPGDPTHAPQSSPTDATDILTSARYTFGKDWQTEFKMMMTLHNQNPGKFSRVLADLQLAIKENRIKKTKGAYFMDAWSRFK